MQRRDFLKFAVSGLAGTLVLAGCGSTESDFVVTENVGTKLPISFNRVSPLSLSIAGSAGRRFEVTPSLHRIIGFGPDGSVLWTIQGPGKAQGKIHFPYLR